LSGIETEVAKHNALPAIPTHFPKINKAKVHWRDLFAGIYLKRTLTAWAMAFATSIVGYGLLAWLPTIYRTVYHLPVGQTLQYSFISYFVGLFGALFGALLIDRFGRRLCYTVSFVGAAAPLLLLAWTAHGVSVPPVETVVTLTSIALFFISILLASIFVYLPEIYPTRMRALGSGTASSWLRVGSIIGPIIVGAILGQAGFGGVFVFFGAMAVVGALVVILFAIETNGKVLEEIAQ
jgi:putative MFS transporter